MQEKGFFELLFDFSFSEFVTTKIIKVLYVLAIHGAGIAALMTLFSGFATKSFSGVLYGLVMTPIVFLLGTLVARIWLETLIVLFRIAENTTKLVRGHEPPTS